MQWVSRLPSGASSCPPPPSADEGHGAWRMFNGIPNLSIGRSCVSLFLFPTWGCRPCFFGPQADDKAWANRLSPPFPFPHLDPFLALLWNECWSGLPVGSFSCLIDIIRLACCLHWITKGLPSRSTPDFS